MHMMEYCLALLERLVAIPSTSRNEEELALFLERYLREELGMDAALQPVADRSCNVRGEWKRPGASRRLLLGGHIDTVPPSDRWTSDPYRLAVQGDIARGLGAGDMKGGLAAQLTVLKQLKEQGFAWDCDVEFLGLADEERHSAGANAYVEAIRGAGGIQQDVFFIMAEPHYTNIVIGAAGKMLYRVDIWGKGGHAAVPDSGINAIGVMAAFLTDVDQAYRAACRRGERASMCCLRVESDYPGYSLNIPEHCFCLLNKQLLPQESGAAFCEELERIFSAQNSGARIAITTQTPSYPSYQIPETQEDVSALLRFLEKNYHYTPELRINQSVSDGNLLYDRLHIPTILFGPQGVDFHTEREHLLLPTLESYMDQLYHYLRARYAAREETAPVG